MRKLINCVLLLSAMTVFTSCFIDDLLDGLKDETVIASEESDFEFFSASDRVKFAEMFQDIRARSIMESILKDSSTDNIAVVLNSESDVDFDYLESHYKEYFLNYDVRSLWPQIDYTKNCLVLGRIHLPQTMPGTRDLVLKKSKGGYRFELTIRPNGMWAGAHCPYIYYFWGIYPKLETDRIENLSYENRLNTD